MAKQYPIGTRIKFKLNYMDCQGKTGKIVDIICGFPLVYLPESNYTSVYSTAKCPATVQTGWEDIEPIPANLQLAFSFMME